MTTTTLQTINRISGHWRAAEARLARPRFIPPPMPASKAREVTLSRWRSTPGLSARGARVVLGREAL